MEFYVNYLLKYKMKYLKEIFWNAINSKNPVIDEFIKIISIILNKFYQYSNPNLYLLREFLEGFKNDGLLRFLMNEFLLNIENFNDEINLQYNKKLMIIFNRKKAFFYMLTMLFCININKSKLLSFKLFYRKLKYDGSNRIYLEKLKGVFNYFDYVYKNYNYYFSLNDIKIIRKKNDYFNALDYKFYYLKDIYKTDKYIQYGDGDLINFANESIGGGTLSAGCVQEEILLLNYPEGLISLFLLNNMKIDECIYVENTMFINDYTGYGSGIKFNNNNNKTINSIIFMDAQIYSNSNKFNMKYIQMDLVYQKILKFFQEDGVVVFLMVILKLKL